MVRQVNLYEAKTHLSRLVEEAAQGAEIVIAKNGKPMARLVAPQPETNKPKKRELGQWAHLADPNDHRTREEWLRDWKAMDKEIERDFYRGMEEDRGEYDTPWPDTSSTQTHSSGPRKDRQSSEKKRSQKSGKRKTSSS